ncbi:MAG TPA: VOC family protein [Candidatus Bathyarchaeia archaeon]
MDHTIIHFEIPAKNVQTLKSFYEAVLGWKIIKTPLDGMDYWLIQTVPTDEKGLLQRPGVNGGLYPRTPDMPGATQVNYISVENIDEYITKVTNAGGKILVPKQQIITVGSIAIAADPEGNSFGLIQPEMPPASP